MNKVEHKVSIAAIGVLLLKKRGLCLLKKVVNEFTERKDHDDLSDRFYHITLLICAIVSLYSIAGNMIGDFPFRINIKWILLFLISVLSLVFLKKDGLKIRNIFLFFCFLVGFFLPFAFMDSGGSSNNVIAYMFLLLIGIVYLFEGWQRIFLSVSLIIVYVVLNVLEFIHPELVAVYPVKTQLIDRIIQVPFVAVLSFLALLAFTKEYERVHKKLTAFANYDELTGLYNRRIFNRIMDEALKSNDKSIHLALLDLDFFKKINDQHGHNAGDEVLIWLSELLKENFQMNRQIVSRWGGDEFAIIYHGEKKELEDRLDEIQKAFNSYVKDYEKTAGISCSIVSFQNYKTIKETITAADRTLYEAKQKNHVI